MTLDKVLDVNILPWGEEEGYVLRLTDKDTFYISSNRLLMKGPDGWKLIGMVVEADQIHIGKDYTKYNVKVEAVSGGDEDGRGQLDYYQL